MTAAGARSAVTAAPARVTCWGELRAERPIPGVLRVLVAGQHADAIERAGDGWRACWYTAAYRDRCTAHATADDAIRAVIRSGWARRLGARAASRLYWSDRPRKAAASGDRAARIAAAGKQAGQ